MSSFFDKIASKLDDLDLGGKDKGEDRYQSRDYPPPSHQRDYPGGGPPQSYGYPGQHQQSYGSPPPPEGYRQESYGSPPPPEGHYQQSYSAPRPHSRGYPDQYQQQQEHYGSPPPPSQEPVYSHPEGRPPLPPGWIPQWDQKYQRWYYAEEATGHTQWEAPGSRTSESRGWAPSGDYGAASHGAPGYGGYENRGSSGYGYEQHGGGGYGGYNPDSQPVEKKKDHTLLYAAGGLAAGAIGGALIANALNDSSDDEEHHHAPPPQQEYAAPAQSSYQDSYAAPGPEYEPAYNQDGEYVDASDRESVASAREDYEAAQRAAADSDASSSEEEELEEAREEYYEEYEDTYE
ncbi:hypothetical protein F4678DRAFT_436771 [Xylaria arbuscula]|nr:hypothetical protein F4678DRAFT_436771 [Xylaria arbuscula]